MMNAHTCHVDPFDKPLDETALDSAMIAYLEVDGMGCERCALRVRNALLHLDAVIAADVVLDRRLAAVAYDPARLLPARLPQAVAGAGRDGRHRYRADIIAIMPAAEALSPGGESGALPLPLLTKADPGGVR